MSLTTSIDYRQLCQWDDMREKYPNSKEALIENIRKHITSHTSVINKLLPNCQGNCLHKATAEGRFTIVQMLVEDGGADINAWDNTPSSDKHGPFTALHIAMATSNLVIGKYLLDQGANVLAMNSQSSFTVIDIINLYGRAECLDLIREHDKSKDKLSSEEMDECSDSFAEDRIPFSY